MVVLGVAAGVALRWWMLSGPRGFLDSDEAVVGLMARHLLDGEWRAFYWGQHYAGSQEAALAAAVFAVTGSSVLALKAVPVALSAVAAALVWRIGRRLGGERPAVVAGLAFWVWPAAYVWWSGRERGFYWVCLVLGLLVLLLAQRLAERPERRADWVGFGLAAGLGWWASPQILFFAVPAGLWLLAAHRRALRGAWLAVVPALVGAAPWLWHNVGRGWPSLDAPPQPVDDGYVDHLRSFAWELAPMALNLRQPFSERWLVDVLAPAAYLVVVAVFAVALWRGGRRTGLLALAVVAFPFLHAVFPTAWHVGEGRYGLFVAPFLALLVGLACRRFEDRPIVLAGVVAVLAAASWYSLSRIGVPAPVDVDDDLVVLEAAGVDRVWAEYWVAYRLSFESGERLVATPPIYHRYQPFVDAVAADDRPAYLFRQGDDTEPRFADELDRLGVAARRVRTDDFVVYLPERPVAPSELAPEARP